MTISPNRDPRWTQDLQAILFGIHIPRKKDAAADSTVTEAQPPSREGDDQRSNGNADTPNPEEKVDLVLWHWQDKRLQSQQEVQETRDRAFSYITDASFGKGDRLTDSRPQVAQFTWTPVYSS